MLVQYSNITTNCYHSWITAFNFATRVSEISTVRSKLMDLTEMVKLHLKIRFTWLLCETSFKSALKA